MCLYAGKIYKYERIYHVENGFSLSSLHETGMEIKQPLNNVQLKYNFNFFIVLLTYSVPDSALGIVCLDKTWDAYPAYPTFRGLETATKQG